MSLRMQRANRCPAAMLNPIKAINTAAVKLKRRRVCGFMPVLR